MTASQLLVLDNLKQGWLYWTNLNRDAADTAYRWAVESGYVKNGKLTPEGEGKLMLEWPKKGGGG